MFATHDSGKTWTDVSGGMNNPVFDLEEDPDNANVLYLGTDYGVFVTIDQGKTWTPFSTSAPLVTIRDLAIQKRDREMAIGTYGRGIYVADIGPIKEFKPDVFNRDAYLFDLKDAIRWNRFERRGDTLGEMAKADNPQVGATIYYYLKADAQKVSVTVKDIGGTTIYDFASSTKKGLQKVFWGLNRQMPGQAGGGRGGAGGGRGGATAAQPARGGAAGGTSAPGAAAPEAQNPDQPPQAQMGRGRVNFVEPGVYKVTLTVDGKEVTTKTLTVVPDPMFK